MSQANRRALLPLAVVAVACLAAVGMVAVRPEVEAKPPEMHAPLVKTLTAEPRDVVLRVHAHGTVEPRTETELVAEVSGRIVWVSPGLAAGGFLDADEPVLRIDPSDYEVGRERAAAGLSRAESQLHLAQSNLSRLRSLKSGGVLSSADLDDAESTMQVAEAARREAQASLLQAERDLSRTEVTSPFVGRIREKRVDLGQYVTRGAPIARVYAVDYAEVRLPISDDEAAFVDLPIAYRNERNGALGPAVTLRADFAGRSHAWHGRIVRTEGELDPKTRMIHAVARVEDPYGRGEDRMRPPLAVGLFVAAEIEGRRVDDVMVLPREALRGRDRVVVVDPEGRLEHRRVDVLRRERDRVLIRGGLVAGESICITSPSIAIDGMPVRTVDARDAHARTIAAHEATP